MSGDQQILKMEGFLTIRDYKTGEVLQEAKNAIKEDPDVKILLDKLGGKVIDSSIEPRQSDE